MKVFLLFECRRDPWQALDEAPTKREVVGVFSDESAPRARIASAGFDIDRSFCIEEFEVDATARVGGGVA
jgi:hypothetical protein